MDKETLSNYGWIVICVLVLAVMIALATPFGDYISTAVKSTTQGLFDTNKNALNSTGLINIGDQSFSDGIPPLFFSYKKYEISQCILKLHNRIYGKYGMAQFCKTQCEITQP